MDLCSPVKALSARALRGYAVVGPRCGEEQLADSSGLEHPVPLFGLQMQWQRIARTR